MQVKTCCVTGHRDIPEGKKSYVEAELRKAVLAAIKDGYTRFISGMAEGVDLTFAAIVAEQKENNPALFLEAAIPYRNRLNARDADLQRLLKACNGFKVLCDKYEPNCFFMRNRYMVAESSRVIAVYDGRERGGTLFTMRAAHTQGKEVRVIEI